MAARKPVADYAGPGAPSRRSGRAQGTAAAAGAPGQSGAGPVCRSPSHLRPPPEGRLAGRQSPPARSRPLRRRPAMHMHDGWQRAGSGPRPPTCPPANPCSQPLRARLERRGAAVTVDFLLAAPAGWRWARPLALPAVRRAAAAARLLLAASALAATALGVPAAAGGGARLALCRLRLLLPNTPMFEETSRYHRV